MIFLFTDYGTADIYVGQVKGVLAEQALSKQPQSGLHDASEDPRECVEKPAQDRGAFAVTPLEDDVDGKLFEGFKPATEHGCLEETRSCVVCAGENRAGGLPGG